MAKSRRKSKEAALDQAVPRVRLGVAMIARDAAETLGPCLDSFRPYVEQVVVCVDERTTDKTAGIAREHGATVFPIKVSDWHECDYHGRVLAQHFAQARQESFAHLDPALDWWMWIDADDIFVHPEKLAEILPKLDPKYIGVWLPYTYSTIMGQSNTEFHRERILRPAVGWDWKFRVHEVVQPRVEGPWFGTEDMKIQHQEGFHRSEESATRNLRLLEIDLEETPDDARCIFYVGNQYFAMANWPAAIEWYERLLGLGHRNPYERWQSAIYLSMAYERLGDLTNATQSAFVALDEVPQHPEPYFRLASIANRAGRFEQAVWWTNMGRQGTTPPYFVFKNPLDYSFNNRTVMGEALIQLGAFDAGQKEWEQAASVIPDPQIMGGLERLAKMRGLIGQADDTARLMHGLESLDSNGFVEELYDRLDPDVRAFPQVRNVAIPNIMAHRPNTQPRIVFWCGRALEEWAPPTLNTTGIGGSETAVVQIAKRFAAAGWRVDVFNGAGRFEGVHDNVGYWDPERLTPDQTMDTLVAWRQPMGVSLPMRSTTRVLWCHDLNYGPLTPGWQQGFQKVLGVSAWHAGMLRQYYDLEEAQVDFVPNGIELDRFTGPTAKMPMRCVYASSPDRGLLRLLGLWPKVVEAEPGADLRIAYGWENIDKAIGAGRRDLAALKHSVEQLIEKTPNVTWLGRLPQDQLAELYQSAQAWTYPSEFLEVSCISAMEAMAGGAVPVASAVGALPETIGDAGILIPGMPHSRPWSTTYLSSLLALLTDPQIRMPLVYRGKERVKAQTWDASFNKWQSIVEQLLSGSGEAVRASSSTAELSTSIA